VAGHPEEYFEALRHSGLPRQPGEYFDPDRHANIIERLAFREMPEDDARPRPNPLWDPAAYGHYLAYVLEAGTTPNGVFGAKLMWGYLGDFAELLRGIDGFSQLTVPDLLTRAFPNLRYLQITREDKIRQAVSLWKAVQTQLWRRNDERQDAGVRTPVFSFRAINYLTRLLTAHDASWDAYFLGLGIEPLKITYEELAEAPHAVVKRVLAYLEIQAPGRWSLDAPSLQIQADDLSEEWVRRVNEHLVALEDPSAQPALHG
jgi:LPS sulfotransferase NodH